MQIFGVEIKIKILIGTSNANVKVINLHYFPPNVNYVVKLIPNSSNDKFHFLIKDNSLFVTKLDIDTDTKGWARAHSCNICISSKESIYLFKETSRTPKYFAGSYVENNGVKIVDSHDPVYFKNKGW